MKARRIGPSFRRMRALGMLCICLSSACAHGVTASDSARASPESPSLTVSAPALPYGLSAGAARREEAAQEVALAAPSYAAADSAGGTSAPTEPAPPPPVRAPALDKSEVTATDAAPAGPILLYAASFALSVFEVDKSQAALRAATEKLGGFVALQTDNALTLRVPAAQFQAALSEVERIGKVLSRDVQALDVGDSYRDLHIRIEAAEAVRKRLQALLDRAENVQDALKVEAELGRVLQQIEQLKGELRALSDRIAYSTIVLQFHASTRPEIDQGQVFRLPFPWLEELGLHTLLQVTP